jgi:tRNA threonylcarbamoyladenosine biosynthesis protein TsaE
MEYISHNLAETQQIADNLLTSLNTGPTATVLGLTGNLGGGKTALTKCMARSLGITEDVTSPTFVIMKNYSLPTTNYPLQTLIHIDAYRLDNGGELEKLGLKDELNNPNNLIIIEWPELVKDILPADTKMITCEFIDETTRKYSY